MFLLRLVILYNIFFFRVFIPAEMMNYDIVVLPTLALVKSVWLPGLRDMNTNNASNGFWSFLLTHSRDNLGILRYLKYTKRKIKMWKIYDRICFSKKGTQNNCS